MIWPQHGHYEEANNLGVGSTHIVGPWGPKYSQQWKICEVGT
jgi:hypothetical protein